MTKTITNLFFLCTLTFFASLNINGQNNIKYGEDFIVFEAEDTNTPLGNKWAIRQPGDSSYLEYLLNQGSSPEPINNTYLEYTGPWQGSGSELEYKFICPKTGTYQIAMRMHSPLRRAPEEVTECGDNKEYVCKTIDGEVVPWEKADKRNDFYIKTEGNYTSGSSKHSESDLRTFHKMFGRGANKWGTCINLEHNGNNGAFYNLTAGEEYTFFLKGRSATTIVDYIAFYNTSYLTHDISNQGPDLALQLPETIRPYETLTSLSITPSPGNVREGTNNTQLNLATTPTNANPEVTWTSSDNSKITVDANGILTAVGAIGDKATITATSTINNSIFTTSEITIVDFFNVAVTSVNVNPTSANIIEGGSLTFTAEVLPTDADDKSITWSSLNEDIALVDQNGNITTVAPGIATIRATSNENNSIYGEATLQVGENIEQSIVFDNVNKYKNGTYRSEGVMEVTFNYHAGSFKTIKDPIKLFLRHIHVDNGWKVVKDVLLNINEPVGQESGTITVDIPLTGVTPTAELPDNDFYYLFVKATNSSNESKSKGINPITILEEALSIEDQKLNNSIKMYPNPAKNYIVIDTDKTTLSTKIYNINGALILGKSINKHNNRIETASLNSGLYLIQFKSENTTTTKKLIIK